MGLQVGIVDCTESSELCSYFGINAYPIFLYVSSARTAIKYRGKRTAVDFFKFAQDPLPENNPQGVYVPIAVTVWKQIA